MRSKKLALGIASIFILFLIVSFVNATMNIYPTSYEANVTQGDSHNFNIKIENTYNDWELYNISVENTTKLDVLDISTKSKPSSVDPNSNSTLKLRVSVPKHTIPGAYSETLEINPMRRNASNHSQNDGQPGPDQLDISINVPETEDLSISVSKLEIHKGNSSTIKIKNEGNVDLNSINLSAQQNWVNFKDENDDELSLFSLTPEEEKEITVVCIVDENDLSYGDNFLSLTAISDSDYKESESLNIYKDFTEVQRTSDIEIEDFEYELVSGYGDADDEKFYPLDKVKATFTLKLDQDDYNIDNIEIEASMFDEKESEIATLEDMKINDNNFDLEIDEEEIDLEITFEINEEILEENEFSGDYTLWIKAEGELEGEEAEEDGLEDVKTATSYESEFDIQEGSIFINNLKIKETIPCNSEIQYKPKIWNLMEKDIDKDENELFIKVYSDELNISKVVSFNKDLDSLETSNFEVLVEIPKGVEEGTYEITFAPYEEYDDQELDDIYQDMGDSDPVYTSKINVSGLWCQTIYNDQTKVEMVNANLESGEKSGDEFIINATITNPEDEQVTFVLDNLTAEWANSVSINPSEITLNSEESKVVEIKIDSKKDVSGDQVLKWTVEKNNLPVANYELPVTIRESKGIKDWFNFNEWNLKTILNVVLGIAIVTVVVVIIVSSHKERKKRRKKSKKENSDIKKAIKK